MSLSNLTAFGWVFFGIVMIMVLEFVDRLNEKRVRGQDILTTAIVLTFLAWLVTP
jgi:hypothetical protein